MKLGATITKEEFLRLAPLGLEAFYDGGTYSYCIEPMPKPLKNGQKNMENSHQN